MPSRTRGHAAKAEPDATQAAVEQPEGAETTDAAALLAAVDAAEAERRRIAARMAARVPDDELEGLPDLELLEEARRRGVIFTRSVTRRQIIDAAKAATAEPQPAEPLGERTKDQLLEEVERREREQGVDLGIKSGATKAQILAALERAGQQAGEPADQQEG